MKSLSLPDARQAVGALREFTRKTLVLSAGIEPASAAPQAAVLSIERREGIRTKYVKF